VATKDNKQSEKDSELLAQARERAERGATYWKSNWDSALDDLKFLNGEQWPESIRIDRELKSRPCLTNNVLPTFVDQVLGDQRQNRPSISVKPVSMVTVTNPAKGEPETLKISNETGTKEYELGEVLSGIIRNIEYNCDAETSYDIAFQSAVESGMGYLRVYPDYVEDESFEQDLIIDHIENQFSVTIDPAARERDKSDMNWCLIDDMMEKDVFEKLYPDASSDPINSGASSLEGWFADNTVRVSEYFTREPVTKEMALLSDGRTVELNEDFEKIRDELAKNGIEVKRTRKVKGHKVVWRKITALDVLEGPIEMPCSTIPVVPVWGKSITIKNKTHFRSIIRYSKDAQRMANYWDSAATEAVALAPKSPFVGTPDQIEGYEEEWETANTDNKAFLPYNPMSPNDQGPRRQQPANVPAAELTLGSSSVEKIKSTLGMFDASIGALSNETSGRAIIARQRQGDKGSFAYIDNLSKAIRRVGKLLVEMVPKIYDTERVTRIKLPDDNEDFVKLNQQVLDEQTQEWVTIHDIGIAKYDVVVTTGPAYATARMEAAESMIQFAQAVPAAAAVMADLIAKNMDWPGADSIANRLRKIIDPMVLSEAERKANAEDAPEPPPPTPEQQIQMAEMEVRGKEVEADMAKIQSEVIKAQAMEANAQADILQAQLKSQEAQMQMQNINAQASGNAAYAQVKELVATALAELMQQQQQLQAQSVT
jgi:hypothetical protein